MRSLTLLVVASLALAVPSAAVAKPDKPVKPRADLVAKAVTGTLAGRTLSLSATVKNKGAKKAKTSITTFRLSTDAVSSADDLVLANVLTKKRKPKKKVVVAATANLTSIVPAGTYRVLACADSAAKVKERKETNNCKAGSVVTVAAPPPAATATVKWRSAGASDSSGPQVMSTVSGGSCSAAQNSGTCTVGGTSTVTLTASVPAPSLFVGWTADVGGTCTGTPTADATITFTNPTANQACVATFLLAS